jgi:hypothetical protein
VALIELVPLILGAMIAPLWIMIVLLMLASPGGLAKAGGFVLGMTLTRLLQGVVFGAILNGSASATSNAKHPSPVVSTLLLIVGLLLLLTAVRTWRKEEDPDDPPPKWMQSISKITPLKAFGLGALGVAVAMKLWVFTLSALGVITAAQLGVKNTILAFLGYIVLAQSLLILAILVCVVAPRTSKSALQRAIAWLTRYNQQITIAAALIFGLYFGWKGISGLLA